MGAWEPGADHQQVLSMKQIVGEATQFVSRITVDVAGLMSELGSIVGMTREVGRMWWR